jgi:hypothetical protein
LTRYAPGDFTVTLRLQPESEKNDRLDLGFLRKPKDDTGVGEGHETWVPLIKNEQPPDQLLQSELEHVD